MHPFLKGTWTQGHEGFTFPDPAHNLLRRCQQHLESCVQPGLPSARETELLEQGQGTAQSCVTGLEHLFHQERLRGRACSGD